jgi:hypothetical protein
MKYIITESQYNKLSEEQVDFDSYLKNRYPNIDNLKMSRFNTLGQGIGRKYYDPETEEWLFRVTSSSPPSWESGKGVVPSNPFIRLSVTQPIYTYIKKYGINFEYEMRDWFNKTYDENVNSVLRGGKPDK